MSNIIDAVSTNDQKQFSALIMFGSVIAFLAYIAIREMRRLWRESSMERKIYAITSVVIIGMVAATPGAPQAFGNIGIAAITAVLGAAGTIIGYLVVAIVVLIAICAFCWPVLGPILLGIGASWFYNAVVDDIALRVKRRL